jgi:hypothetical protein
VWYGGQESTENESQGQAPAGQEGGKEEDSEDFEEGQNCDA